jgi:hypothetical protein
MTQILGSAFADRSALAVRRRAMVSLAISFNTWKSLVKIEGLTNEEAADLLAHLVASVR